MPIDNNEKNARPCVCGRVMTVVALFTADGRSRKATPGEQKHRGLLAGDCAARLIRPRHILCVLDHSVNGTAIAQ